MFIIILILTLIFHTTSFIESILEYKQEEFFLIFFKYLIVDLLLWIDQLFIINKISSNLIFLFIFSNFLRVFMKVINFREFIVLFAIILIEEPLDNIPNIKITLPTKKVFLFQFYFLLNSMGGASSSFCLLKIINIYK